MNDKLKPRFKRGDVVYYFNYSKNEVMEDTIFRVHESSFPQHIPHTYHLYKSNQYMNEGDLATTPLECLNQCYINAQEEMYGAERELQSAQRNVQFFYDLCKEEQKRIESEKANQPCE